MSILEGPWKQDYIVSNGVKLHYVTQGEGPLMLFLHGFPEFWYSWRHQIPEFAQDYHVVALDMRGYNDSDKPHDPSSYTLDELILDIEGVVQGLGYDRCFLVGHDWGGAVAWTFADAYPHMVEKLAILNMPHPAKFIEGLRQPQQMLRSWYIALFQLPAIPELLLQLNDYRAITAIFDTATNKRAFTSADLGAYKDAAAKRGALTAMLNYYRNLWPGLLAQRIWGTLTMPTLMIWGENDVALGSELIQGTEVYVPDLRIQMIANSGHWVQQEQPLLVNQCLREFFTGKV